MGTPSDYSKETGGSLCLGSEPGHLMVPCHVRQLTRAQIQFQSSQQRLPYAPYALPANPGAKHVALGWLTVTREERFRAHGMFHYSLCSSRARHLAKVLNF